MIVPKTGARRRGLVSVVLVTGLLVLMILAAGLVRLAAIRHDDQAMAARRLQAEWLAVSGLDRASAKLASSADYAGETWTMPISDRDQGRVSIRVEPAPGLDRSRRVHITAEFPTGGARHSIDRTIALDPKTPPTTNPDRKGDAPR